jgi:hypothetical protein
MTLTNTTVAATVTRSAAHPSRGFARLTTLNMGTSWYDTPITVRPSQPKSPR